MRILLLSFLSSLLLTACNKDKDPQTTFEVSFTRDGKQEVFTPYYAAVQPNNTMPGVTDFMMTSRSKDSRNEMHIVVQVKGDFKEGTYVWGNTNYTVIADYFENIGTAGELDYTIDQAPGQSPCNFTVNIQNITASEIKGSFSGNYLYDRLADKSTRITGGSFVVKKR